MEPHAACKAAIAWIKSRASSQTHNLFLLVNNSVQIAASTKTENVKSGLSGKSRKVKESISSNDDGSRISNTRRRKIRG